MPFCTQTFALSNSSAEVVGMAQNQKTLAVMIEDGGEQQAEIGLALDRPGGIAR